MVVVDCFRGGQRSVGCDGRCGTAGREEVLKFSRASVDVVSDSEYIVSEVQIRRLQKLLKVQRVAVAVAGCHIHGTIHEAVTIVHAISTGRDLIDEG